MSIADSSYRILPPTLDGRIPFADGETWFRVTGDLSSGVTPLVVAHGGPGATHQYLLSLTAFADPDGPARPVVHYDQLGCGNSTHLPDADPSYWTVELFLTELENLVALLGIADNYHLLGQSWGGMLAAEHAVRRPAGLRRLVIANSPASMPLWLEAAASLRAGLPPVIDQTLRSHEEAGTTDSPEYEAAMTTFYDRHVCRVVPNPPEVRAAFAALEEDPTVYHTMNGPSEFHVVGSLRDWSIVDRLANIDVPTLVISGVYDEAAPVTVIPYAKLIPDVRWEVFEYSSHMPHIEEHSRYVSMVESFLRGRD
ncbi:MULTISPECIES: proline iminopeptidase-family hydrolase [unclassified Kribbella]|uniref:proline iminopeptidase-family hydrolase n=1 Tax=unclassified Kribbella TaxID=2644121 RepID=UPI00371DF4B7|nr:proline iminopeptidase-family hydrolase [Kribbella sp. NBC_00889]